MLTDGLRFLEGSTNTNLVLPVVTATAKAALSANTGEVVFQSDGTKGLYVYDGTQWVLGIDISAASSAIAASRLPAFTGDVTSTAGTSALTLAASGVTAGTYKSVTVNAKGLVTAGTNPTTLAGYGITDAYTKAQVDTAVANASGGVVTFASVTAKPTTISGYGILDAYTKAQVDTAITNATPTLTFASLSGKPTTLAGYGITDSVLSTDVRLTDARTPLAHTHVIADVTNLQTALDDKLTKNADIVAGTSIKITYDAKGLVTAGAALTSTDIPALSTDKITSGVFDAARLPADVVYTVGGALPSALVPTVSLTGTITPNTYADMTAATATAGTVAIVTADSDLTKNATYVKGTDGTWKKLNVATNNVASINGKTGNIAKILPEDISGVFDTDANKTLLSAKLPLFTGDVVSTSGARNTLTLNTIPGLTAGASYASVTVNSKGLVTGGVVGSNYTTVQADAKFVTKVAAGEKNAANGYLGLNATGKIEATYLPLFDGDVVSTSGARNTLTLKTISGLAAGTYSSVTINTKGLVTGGTLGENYTKVEADAKYLTKAVSGARNVAEGFVGLNSDGKIDAGLLPAITVNAIQSVTTIVERDALTGLSVGDMAIVGGSVNKTFILSSVSPATWVEMLNPTGGVTSINGNSGVVTIDLSNIPGTLSTANMPVYTTGDVVTNVVSNDLELKTVSGLTTGSYTKVTVNTKGIVTAGTQLVAADIPNLSWNKIATDKPTTLSGFGITDGVLSTDGRLTDSRTPLAHIHAIADVTDLQSSLDDKVIKNTDITAGTAFKITYDAKGLVTSGDVLSASDIPALSTDAITSGVFDAARLPADVVYTVGGALPSALVPTVSLTGTITPDTYADMTAATAATGTVAIVTADSDLTKNGSYVKGTDGTWKKLTVGTNAVASINGKTGNIAKILPEDISGVFDTDANTTLLSAKLPLFTGDVVSTSGARSTLTLNTIPGLTAGASYASVTVNAKGLVTGGVVGSNYTTVQADAKFLSKTDVAANAVVSINGKKGIIAKIVPEDIDGLFDNDINKTLLSSKLPVFGGDVESTSGARTTLTLKENSSLSEGVSYSSVTINKKGLVTGGIVGENYTKLEADAKYLTKAVSGARNVAEGFVGLNSTGKIDATYLPAITVNAIKTATTLAERDALTGVVVGDMAIVAGSVNKTYVLSSLSPKTWVEMLNPTGGVTSINGNSGVVTIDLSNIPGTLSPAKMPVYTTGDVVTNVVSNDLELKTVSGLTAGSYSKVTVNTKGIVTAGTNPTTIADFGITNAYTKTEVDTAISNATPVLTFTSLTGKPTTLSGYGITDAVTPTDITTAIDAIKANVPAAGDNLNKLYDLVVSSFKEVTVATVAARDLYNVTALPTNVFVTDDGDGKWALYKATTTGVGATFVKLSDPDLLNAAVSMAFTPENVANKSIDGTFTDNSDTKYPSQKAVKTYADTKLAKNVDIVAGTATKITYDAKGLVTAGAALVEADLPALAISKITNLQTSLDAKLAKNVDIVAGTGTKITYDAKGLVLSSTTLNTSDLPTNLVYTTGGKIDSTLLPSIALTNTYVISDVDADSTNIETYAIGATLGSIAILTNISKTYIVSATDPAVVWTELLAPTDSVKTVNGKNGSSISLSYDDIDSGSADIVTAGAYNNVTVNAKGRVTAAANTAYAALDGNNQMNAANLPTFIGDVTLDTANNTLSLSTVANVAGTYNTATAHAPLTIDSKGRVSAVGAAVTITPAFADITGKPTTLSGYGISDSVELTTRKNAASGYAGLDGSSKLATSVLPSSVVLLNASGKIDSSVLPAVSLSNTFVVSDAAANATNIDTYTTGAAKGDIAILTAVSETYILTATTPTKVWTELLSPTGGITSVNGLTGTTLSLTYTNIDTASADIVTAGTYNNVTVNAKGRVTAAANTTYATLDGSSRLLVTNLPAYTGDVTKAAGSAATVVAKVNGTTVVNPATKTAGMVLSLDSDTTQATWKAISLPAIDANGKLLATALPLFTGGDIVTATSSATLNISKINGIPLDTTISGSALPTNGFALTYDSTALKATWRAVAKLGANTFTDAQTATRFISNVATGTAPFSVTSTTVVPNLNVSTLNGIAITGTPAVGHVLTATSTTAASWAAGGGGGGTSDTAATANTIAKRTSDGSLYATNFYSTSSRELKENIQPIENVDISALSPVTFNFIADENHKLHYGLIAEEVEQVFPALVEVSDAGTKSVNYVEIIALLLADNKRLNDRLNAIEARLA